MKKVLILAYDFPPYVSVGGLRPYSWYKYLKEFGIEPVVITRQWDNKYGNSLDYIAPSKRKHTVIEKTELGTILKTPYQLNFSNKIQLKYSKEKYKLFRKLLSGYYEAIQWFFNVGPKNEIFKAAKDYLINNQIDLIITTGEPFILFKYASKLSSLYDIPWIADYRDPWSQNKLRSKNYFLKKWNTFFEKKYLKNVNTITTVSTFFKEQISQLIPDKPYKIIPNGFDPDAVKEVENIFQGSNDLSIAFIGTLYKWHPIDSFLKVCAQFVKNKTNLRFKINFYGINTKDEINNKLKTNYYSLMPYVSIYPKMSNSKLLKELTLNNVFLLFNYYSYTGTKIYDYLALKRKILFCYSNDEEAEFLKLQYYNVNKIEGANNHLQEDLIKETHSGIIVKDSKHLLEALNDLYQEFQENGKIECHSKNIEQFSRKIQTQKLAGIIKEVIDGYHSHCLLCGSKRLKQINGYEIDYLVRCQDCGFVFSSRIPTEGELLKHYEGYGRNDYLSPITIKRYNELLDIFEKYRKTNRILDIGCGIGYFLEEAKKRGWKVYGTEITDLAIEICEKKSIEMFKGKLTDSNFESEIFDVITSFEVIEHINNPQEELRNINKLLRKGGVFYFTTPNFNAIERYLLKGKYNVIYYPEHLSYYSAKTINYLLSSFELKKLWLKTTGFSFVRFKSRTKISPHTQIVTPDAEDEKIRNRIEKNIILRIATKIMNKCLSILKIGNSIKGLYKKK